MNFNINIDSKISTNLNKNIAIKSILNEHDDGLIVNACINFQAIVSNFIILFMGYIDLQQMIKMKLLATK